MPATITTLLSSRKFIANLLATLVCAVMLMKGTISSTQFTTVLASLTGVFTLAVAHEDASKSKDSSSDV